MIQKLHRFLSSRILSIILVLSVGMLFSYNIVGQPCPLPYGWCHQYGCVYKNNNQSFYLSWYMCQGGGNCNWCVDLAYHQSPSYGYVCEAITVVPPGGTVNICKPGGTIWVDYMRHPCNTTNGQCEIRYWAGTIPVNRLCNPPLTATKTC